MALLLGQRATLRNAGYRSVRKEVTLKDGKVISSLVVMDKDGKPVLDFSKWSKNPPSIGKQWDSAWNHWHKVTHGYGSK